MYISIWREPYSRTGINMVILEDIIKNMPEWIRKKRIAFASMLMVL